MAGTLKVKIEEEIILNNQNYGSKRTLSIASVAEIYKRVVNVPANGDTTLATFAAAANTSHGAFDAHPARHIRFTNLPSPTLVHVPTVGSSAHVPSVVPAGVTLHSRPPHPFPPRVPDTSPAFSSFEDLASIVVDSGSNAVDVELFIASV